MADYGFKFQIGDVVRHVGALLGEHPGSWFAKGTVRYIIISQVSEMCSGDQQRHYRVRAFRADGGISDRTFQVHELELAASEPFRREEDEARER